MSILEARKHKMREFSWQEEHVGHTRSLLEKLWLWLPAGDTVKISFENGQYVYFSTTTHDAHKVLAWTEQNHDKRPAHIVFKELGIEPHTRWSYQTAPCGSKRKPNSYTKKKTFTPARKPDAALFTQWMQLVPLKLPKQPQIHKSLDQARYRDAARSPSIHESVAKTVDTDDQMRIELEKIQENGMLSPRDKRLLGKLLDGSDTSDENIQALAAILRKYPAVLKRLALRREMLETTRQ